MPTKRYRLKLEHPVAKKGAILVEIDRENSYVELREESSTYIGLEIKVPKHCLDTWLEEVKEEPTCSKEFSEAILAYIKEHGNDGWVWTGESKSFKYWLERHTSKE